MNRRLPGNGCKHCGATDYEYYGQNAGCCKSCRLRINKEARALNPEQDRARCRRYRKRILEYDPKLKWAIQTQSRLRNSAKVNCIPYDLDRDFLYSIGPATCPALGIDISYRNATQQYNSPSVDKLDPKKGYTKDNVSVLCSRANTIKSDATYEEVQKVADWMKSVSASQ